MTTRSLSRAALVFLLIAVCVPDSLRGQMGTPTPDGAPLALQPAPLFGDPVGPAMQQPGEKSTWLAGLLSFFLPYGTGSFYAGNSSHGVRHLVIGGTALVGTVVGLAIACDDGFNYCDEDNAGWYVAGGFAIVWLGNWVWGTIVAVNDANAYNRQLAEVGFAPELKMLAPVRTATHGTLSSPAVGIQLVQVTF
jgi:hypothetical protein